jgi:hypothetical protein
VSIVVVEGNSLPFGGLSVTVYFQMIRKDLRHAPLPTTRSKRRSSAKGPASIANDPVRTAAAAAAVRLEPELEQLKGENFARLIDYIIHYGMPKTLQDNVLIGTSNSLSWFQEMSKQFDDKSKSYDPHNAQVLRTGYQPYSLQGYHFLAVNSGRGHFSVVSVNFDKKNDNMFDRVCDVHQPNESMFPIRTVRNQSL